MGSNPDHGPMGHWTSTGGSPSAHESPYMARMDETETSIVRLTRMSLKLERSLKWLRAPERALVILTFSSAKLPVRVHVGYESVPVRPYIPNPLCCFQC